MFILNMASHVNLKTAPFQLINLSQTKRQQFIKNVPTLQERRNRKNLLTLAFCFGGVNRSSESDCIQMEDISCCLYL
jgi:hypothetical protein